MFMRAPGHFYEKAALFAAVTQWEQRTCPSPGQCGINQSTTAQWISAALKRMSRWISMVGTGGRVLQGKGVQVSTDACIPVKIRSGSVVIELSVEENGGVMCVD